MNKQEGSKRFSLWFNIDFAELKENWDWGMLAYPLLGLAYGSMSGWAMFIVVAAVALVIGYIGSLLPMWGVVVTSLVMYLAGLAVVLRAEIKGIALGSRLTAPRVYIILISVFMLAIWVGHLNW